MGKPTTQQILRALSTATWAMEERALRAMVRAAVRGPDAFADEIQAATPQRPTRPSGTVAVVQIFGVISPRADWISNLLGWASLDTLSATLGALVNDPSIDAIVFEIDSPGGSVEGCTEFAAQVRAARGVKPVYAIANGTADSAAFHIASQAEKLFVTPSGQVGSVGVFTVHEDWSKAEEMAGVKVTYVAAGKYKTEANSDSPLSDEAAAALQAQVDEFYGMFVADVAKGRGVSIDTVRSGYGEGRVVLAKDALATGMVDGVDTLDNVVRMAARAGATKRRAAASAAALTPDIQAGPDADLPFSDRLALVSAWVGGLVEHANARVDMRAKERRAPFSAEDRQALVALADSLSAVAAVEAETEPPVPTPDPEPTPPARAAHRRAQVALALAELGA